MAWTNVTKPTNTSWTPNNPGGRTQYDQVNVSYDDASIYYDGVDYSAWSNVSKPASTSWTNISKPV